MQRDSFVHFDAGNADLVFPTLPLSFCLSQCHPPTATHWPMCPRITRLTEPTGPTQDHYRLAAVQHVYRGVSFGPVSLAGSVAIRTFPSLGSSLCIETSPSICLSLFLLTIHSLITTNICSTLSPGSTNLQTLGRQESGSGRRRRRRDIDIELGAWTASLPLSLFLFSPSPSPL